MQRLRHLVRTYWSALLVMGGVAGAYGAYSLLEVRQPFTDSKLVDLPVLAWNMVGTAVVGALGGPWRWRWQPGGAWADAPMARRRRRDCGGVARRLASCSESRAWWAWVLLIGYLVMGCCSSPRARLLSSEAEIGLAYRLQTDVAPWSCAWAWRRSRSSARSTPASTGTVAARTPRLARPLTRVLSRPTPTPWCRWVPSCWSTCPDCCAGPRTPWSWHEHNASRRPTCARSTANSSIRAPRTTSWTMRCQKDVLPSALTRRTTRSARCQTSRPEVQFYRRSRLAVVSSDGGLHEALVRPSVSPPGPHRNCGWLVGRLV